jgi:leader peptidase (prepilin peptidase)/N-methyltransferase
MALSTASVWHTIAVTGWQAVVIVNLVGAILSAAFYGLARYRAEQLVAVTSALPERPWHKAYRFPWLILPAGAASGSILLVQFGFSAATLAGIFFCSALLALGLTDARTGYLPNIPTVPLLATGLAINTIPTFVPLDHAVVGALAGYMVLWLVNTLFHAVTARQGLGYGDMKLLAAIGAWLGWPALPGVLLLASGCGLMVALAHRLRGTLDAGQAISFGPYLALAGAFMLITTQ